MNHAVKVVWIRRGSNRRIATVVEGFVSTDEAQLYADTCQDLRLSGAAIVTVGPGQERTIDQEEVLVWDDVLDVQVAHDIAVEWLEADKFERGSATLFERRWRS